MSRFLRVSLLLFLAACGGGDYSAPRNLDNACAFARERPEYMSAMERAERRWSVPVHVQMAMIYQESKFIGDARTPFKYSMGVIPMGRQSSAYGYSQALDGTWEEYQDETGNRRAKRDRIDDATDFVGWYVNRTVDRNGVPRSDARNQYLAYHEGHNGYAKGSYNDKAWLLRVADNVATRATMYESQLLSCRGRGKPARYSAPPEPVLVAAPAAVAPVPAAPAPYPSAVPPAGVVMPSAAPRFQTVPTLYISPRPRPRPWR